MIHDYDMILTVFLALRNVLFIDTMYRFLYFVYLDIENINYVFRAIIVHNCVGFSPTRD